MKKVTAFLRSVVSCQLSIVFFFLALFFLISSFILNTSSLNSVHAACPYGQSESAQDVFNEFNRCAIKENVFDSTVFNAGQIWASVDSLNLQLYGTSALHPETDDVTAGRGALAATSSLIALVYYNPPASGMQYFAQEIKKLNPVQPAYAQTGTTGFDALQPVASLWRVFRNISYAGFIIVFVIMGFMIMFRAHISPQAVATVQDSIPRITVALILVTFSYAIAGLMLDIMYVALNLLINLLGQAGVLRSNEALITIFDQNIFKVMITAWDDLIGITAKALSQIIKEVVDLGTIGKLFSWAIGGIGGLIVGVAALFIMFRIFFMLLMAYVMIIVLTLVAPFYFLIQALPGNNGAKEWFKQMAANVSVFPVVSLMVIFAGIIAGIGTWGGTGAGELQNIGSQSANFPLLGGSIAENAIGKVIGLGFLFMTPQAAQMIKDMIGTKGGPALGGAMAGLAPGMAVAGAIGRGGYKQALQDSRLPLIGGARQRQRESERQERAQEAAKSGIYSKRYEELQTHKKEEGTS